MNAHSRTALLTAACLIGLAACGGQQPPSETATTPAPAPATETPPPIETAPVATPAATPPAASDKPAAVVSDCSTEIEGSDAMQFNVGSITVPASCTSFTITLKHTGTMPVAAMGHNVVIAQASDMQAVAADGMAAGAAAMYVKPGDTRVIAHSDVVGGGQSTSVSFDVGKIKDGGPYEFFCSFPGHSAMMKGTIAVE